MARPANRYRAIPHCTPHCVAIRLKDPWNEELVSFQIEPIKKWIRSPEQVGYYRFDEGTFQHNYYFSDENTALECRLRFA